MSDNSISNQVYISRDQIRNQIITALTEYLELGNIDLTKSSFLSFVINTLSTLSSNLLFYELSVYREFFLTEAQIPDSVYKLATFIGYDPTLAIPAEVDNLMTIPLNFHTSPVNFIIPSYFTFKASGMNFRTYYSTEINVYDNTMADIEVTHERTGSKRKLNVSYDSTSDPPTFSFVLPLRQYNKVEQEYQVPSDIQAYQFISITIPIGDEQLIDSSFLEESESQSSNPKIIIVPPGGTLGEEYREFKSLFLMTTSDAGYVKDVTPEGITVTFGNNLLGKQPPASGKIYVTYYTTSASSGNILPGSLQPADRIYTELPDDMMGGARRVFVVSYACANPFAPYLSGRDTEDIDQIRKNAINSLVSKERFVSNQDFKNANVIIPNSPFGVNSLPVLKRSDVKCNEIQLFTTLVFAGEVVPTRNEKLEIPIGMDRIPTGYEIIVYDDPTTERVFVTLFDIIVNDLNILNGSADYYYIMNRTIITPTLLNADEDVVKINIGDLYVEVDDSTGSLEFVLNYTYKTGDISNLSCSFQILNTLGIFEMEHDVESSCFRYVFDSYTDFPEDLNLLTFSFVDLVGTGFKQIKLYSAHVLVRKSLAYSMMSNIAEVDDSTTIIVYDIPCIEKTYKDRLISENQWSSFELNCIQNVVLRADLGEYRMLTDFINIKFPNTSGIMKTMQHNLANKLPVINIIDAPPEMPFPGNRYIVSSTPEVGAFYGYNNYYATCTFFSPPDISRWQMDLPLLNDFVYVINQNRKYLYNGSNWIIPEYPIPLQIYAEIVKKPTYTKTDSELTSTIISAIMDSFSSTFGLSAQIFRAEIIKVIQQVPGVSNCNLILPRHDIFFNYNLDKLQQEEVMEFTPEYIYFSESSIQLVIL